MQEGEDPSRIHQNRVYTGGQLSGKDQDHLAICIVELKAFGRCAVEGYALQSLKVRRLLLFYAVWQVTINARSVDLGQLEAATACPKRKSLYGLGASQ